MLSEQIIIAQTQKWIQEVVIGLNFCPFAIKEVEQQNVLNEVAAQHETESIIHQLYKLLQIINNSVYTTAIIIIPEGLESFSNFLQSLNLAETLIIETKYEGIY